MKDTESCVNKAEVKRKIRVWLDYRTSRQVTDGLLDLIEKLPVMVKGQLETTLESNWVSVKDRMPNEDEAAMVYNAKLDSMYVDYPLYLGEPKLHFDAGVTHWMPLPQKPESEGDAE